MISVKLQKGHWKSLFPKLSVFSRINYCFNFGFPLSIVCFPPMSGELLSIHIYQWWMTLVSTGMETDFLSGCVGPSLQVVLWKMIIDQWSELFPGSWYGRGAENPFKYQIMKDFQAFYPWKTSLHLLFHLALLLFLKKIVHPFKQTNTKQTQKNPNKQKNTKNPQRNKKTQNPPNKHTNKQKNTQKNRQTETYKTKLLYKGESRVQEIMHRNF